MKNLKITSSEILGVSPASAPAPARRGNRVTRIPEILDVAFKVFATEGYIGFTQRRIADAAGIRLGTLQHYFGTREELLRRTITELANRHIAEYQALAKNTSDSPTERLENIVDRVFNLLQGPEKNTGLFALHCWSLAEHEPFVADLMSESQGKLIDLFTGLIGKINPQLPSGECALRATLIVSHMQGLIVIIRRRSDSDTDWDALRVATKAVWKALSTAHQ